MLTVFNLSFYKILKAHSPLSQCEEIFFYNEHTSTILYYTVRFNRKLQNFMDTCFPFNSKIFLLVLQIFLSNKPVHFRNVRVTQIFLNIHPHALLYFPVTFNNVRRLRFQSKGYIQVGTTINPLMCMPHREQGMKLRLDARLLLNLPDNGVN